MDDQKLKSNWKSGAINSIYIQRDELLTELQRDTISLEKKITFRDSTEIIVALLLIVLFGIIALLIPFMLSKIGSIVIILSCVFIILRFKNLKDKFSPITLTETHAVYLKKTRYYLTEQIKFLKSVAYWYIIPPISGILLFFAGFGINTFQFYKLSGITLAVGFGIYLLNRFAIKKELQPRLDRINSLIDSLSE
jgi:hypothetical protein